MFKDWTDDQILQAYRNGGLATLVYQAQVEYVGPEHEIHSVLLLARIFKVLADTAPASKMHYIFENANPGDGPVCDVRSNCGDYCRRGSVNLTPNRDLVTCKRCLSLLEKADKKPR